MIQNRVKIYNLKDLDLSTKIEQSPEIDLKMKIILGDKSDNIPGIKGFGKKKIEKYFNGDVDFNDDERKLFETNLQLVTLIDSGEESEYVKSQLDNCSFKTDWTFFMQKVEELKFNIICPLCCVPHDTFISEVFRPPTIVPPTTDQSYSIPGIHS